MSGTYVLLQGDAAEKITTTDAATMLPGRRHLSGDATAMDGHVCLEITFGGEGSTAESTAVRTFSRVCAVMHQQSATAAQHAVAYHTLVRVGRCIAVTRSAAFYRRLTH